MIFGLLPSNCHLLISEERGKRALEWCILKNTARRVAPTGIGEACEVQNSVALLRKSGVLRISIEPTMSP
jgi:hypothetical protein